MNLQNPTGAVLAPPDDPAFRIELIHSASPGVRREVVRTRAPSGRLSPGQPAFAQTIGRLAGALDQAGVSWVLADGTLLGLTRDNDAIAGDNDIDVKLPLEQVTPDLLDHLTDAGFQVHRKAWFHDRLCNFGMFFNGISVDVNGYETHGAVARYRVLLSRKGTDDILNGYLTNDVPLTGRKPCTFLGHKVWIPDDPERYLEACYGPDWRHPVDVSTWNHLFSYRALVSITGDSECLLKGFRRLARARQVPLGEQR